MQISVAVCICGFLSQHNGIMLIREGWAKINPLCSAIKGVGDAKLFRRKIGNGVGESEAEFIQHLWLGMIWVSNKTICL